MDAKIYLLKTNDNLPKLTKFLNTLNIDELQKYEKFIYKNDAINYLYSHALLKIILSQIKKCDYKDLKFFTNKYGKPYVNHGPYFSISHTQGIIGIAISNIEIGLDIENINRKINWQDFDLIFNVNEKKYLYSINYNYDDTTYYKIWTYKESIVKALGIGLNLPLNKIVLPIKNLNNKTKILAVVKQNGTKFIHCNNIKLSGYSCSIAGNGITKIIVEQIQINNYL